MLNVNDVDLRHTITLNKGSVILVKNHLMAENFHIFYLKRAKLPSAAC